MSGAVLLSFSRVCLSGARRIPDSGCASPYASLKRRSLAPIQRGMLVCPEPCCCHSRASVCPAREESRICSGEPLPCATGPIAYTS